MSKATTNHPSPGMVTQTMPSINPGQISIDERIRQISNQNLSILSETILKQHLQYLAQAKIDVNSSHLRDGTTILIAGQYPLTLKDIFEKPPTCSNALSTKYQIDYFEESILTITGMSHIFSCPTKKVYLMNDENKLVGEVKTNVCLSDISIYNSKDKLRYKLIDGDPHRRKWKWLFECPQINSLTKCLKYPLIRKREKKEGKLILKDIQTKKKYEIGNWARKIVDNKNGKGKLSIKTFNVTFPSSLTPEDKILVISSLVAEAQLSIEQVEN